MKKKVYQQISIQFSQYSQQEILNIELVPIYGFIASIFVNHHNFFCFYQHGDYISILNTLSSDTLSSCDFVVNGCL
jgi:hypothetical protein